MTTLSLEFYTADFGWHEFASVLRGGEVVQAIGLLNLKWEDFSAWEFARGAELGAVDWQTVRDDTPGILLLQIEFPHAKAAEVSARFAPFLQADLTCSCTETVERQTAVTDV